LAPINFEEENENNHIEKEIKKYASEKPDQVADIIKSWMTEDER
jgi:flagellar M-ring protein FliF